MTRGLKWGIAAGIVSLFAVAGGLALLGQHGQLAVVVIILITVTVMHFVRVLIDPPRDPAIGRFRWSRERRAAARAARKHGTVAHPERDAGAPRGRGADGETPEPTRQARGIIEPGLTLILRYGCRAFLAVSAARLALTALHVGPTGGGLADLAVSGLTVAWIVAFSLLVRWTRGPKLPRVRVSIKPSSSVHIRRRRLPATLEFSGPAPLVRPRARACAE